MSGMEIPLLLAGGGALIGSQVDKENPMRGALLGGAAGFTGGSALAPATVGATGVGSAGAASSFGTLSAAPTAGTFGALSSAAPTTAGTFGATLGTQAGSAAATAQMMAGTNAAVSTASNAVAGGVANPYTISPMQAMMMQRAMGGFGQQQGSQTQSAPFKPGKEVNLADPIASLLAPKRKKERPMISLL